MASPVVEAARSPVCVMIDPGRASEFTIVVDAGDPVLSRIACDLTSLDRGREIGTVAAALALLVSCAAERDELEPVTAQAAIELVGAALRSLRPSGR